MYQVKCVNGTDSKDIYNNDAPELLLVTGKITEGINKTGAFDFSIPVTNNNFDSIKTLASEIVVEDVDGVEIYRGRPKSKEPDIYNTTLHKCEGVLAYLLDTKYPPFVHTGGLSLFLRDMLDYHNARVTDKQKIYLGNITVEDSNDYIRRESGNYTAILELIQEKLVKNLGGFLQIRRVSNKNYLDYLGEYPVSDQVARLGMNVVDLSRCIDASTVKSVIIPLGAEDEETGEKVNISSVNNGKNYLVDEELVAEYGWIEEVVEFDDVTLPENVLAKGKKYMADCKHMKFTVELDMVDCRMIGMDVSRLHPGMQVKVEADFHNLDTYFLCTSKETDILDPGMGKIVLGSEFKTFTSSNTAAKKEYEERIVGVRTTMSERIKRARQDFNDAIASASGLYETVMKQNDGSSITYYHDKKKLEDSLIQMVFNSAGFAISSDGGKNWYGMKVDGDFIANILSAEGIEANWIKTGKILSADYKENESGICYDLDNSEIVSYFINPYNNHHYKAVVSKSVITFTDMDSSNMSVSIGLSGLSLLDGENGVAVSAGAGGIQVSEYDSSGTVTGKVYIRKGSIEISENCALRIRGTTSYKDGITNKVLLSDGTTLEFRNGIYVG